MSTLFGKKRKRKVVEIIQTNPSVDIESSGNEKDQPEATNDNDRNTNADHQSPTITEPPPIFTFEETNLLPSLVSNCHTLGFRKPTPIQRFLIPYLLQQSINTKDPVVAYSATGTGKTAAFVLPILHHLSQDPYSGFAVILTPTRELAQQIHQQVVALGVPLATVKSQLVVGGLTTPSSVHSAHILVATPGRLGTLLRTAAAPKVGLAQYLVLDEADRLLSPESDFEKDVAEVVLQCKNAQTVMLSATRTASLKALQEITGREKKLRTFVAKDSAVATLAGDEQTDLEGKPAATGDKGSSTTQRPKIPAGLVQEYLFMPDKVRDAYILATIRALVVNGGRVLDDDNDDSKRKKKRRHNKKHRKTPTQTATPLTNRNVAQSAIIFCATCERTALLSTMLEHVGVANVALHSVLSQDRRLAVLAKFRDHRVRILVATDVAARGLDLEHVDLVVNASVPRNPVNYVHRVGRTARAGRRGRAVTLVSEREVDLVQAAEALAGRGEMPKCTQVTDEMAIPLLGVAAKAKRLAQMKLQEIGWDELFAKFKERKVRDRKERDRRRRALEKMEEEAT